MIIVFDDLKDIHPVQSFSFECITPSLIFEEDTDFSLQPNIWLKMVKLFWRLKRDTSAQVS